MHLFTYRHIFLSVASFAAILTMPGTANAACSGIPTAGNDILTCDGSPPATQATPLDLLTGNDTLLVTGGTYSGGITGGTGAKTITLDGGSIASYSNTAGTTGITFSAAGTANVTGGVTTGNGVDSFVMAAGTVGGAVTQGAGIDDFQMTGGAIQSLAQGDGRDTFFMSGGTITGAFEDGDVATMTGGTIGRVDMKLDNNIFNMSGGSILGNLVTGFGSDTITLSNGTIGGNISVSGGIDSVTITGGTVNGNVMMSTGQDSFTWAGGGAILGTVDMGPDNDTATLSDLTSVNLANTKLITGGDGSDTLVLSGSSLLSAVDAGLIRGFETWLKNGAGTWTVSGTITDALTMTVQQGTLALTGDNSAYAGQMIVNAAGTLEGRAQSLTPQVSNSGLVRFAQPDTGTYSGLISGSGRVEKTGAGTTILTANQTYTGGTTITAGTLQLGNGGGTGSVAGDIVDNGILAFNRSDIFTFNGVISGAGALSQAGPGTTVLTAASSYGGLTSVTGGTLAVGDAAHQGAALAGGGSAQVAAGAIFGGYGSIAGNVTNNGTIAVADAITAFSGQGNGNFTIGGTLINAGLAQVGGQAVGNTLIAGSYAGQNGTVALNTFLGVDNSPSDRLVINGGSASGTSSLQIANVGGPGGQTLSSGILVVDAVNGGTTSPDVFTLSQPVAAGAYQYFLFRGGMTQGTADNWYLRNTVVAPATPAPGDPPVEPPSAAPGTPPLPPAIPGATPIPLYRVQVPLYSAIPPISREMGLQVLGTFHDRRGEQPLLDGQGFLPSSWMRFYGGHAEQGWSGAAKPVSDGDFWGLQAGQDIYGIDNPSGHKDRLGLFFGYSQSDGGVSGFALGTEQLPVGTVRLDSYNLGAYWTHIGPSGWYLDGVLMNSWLDGDPRSPGETTAKIDGSLFAASAEGGYPIALGDDLTLEPQAQIILQHLTIDDAQDRVSTVRFGNLDTFTGRAGARLKSKYMVDTTELRPYLKVNLWQDFGPTGNLVFGASDIIATHYSATAFEAGAGLIALLTERLRLFVEGSYTTDIGQGHQRVVKGNAGVSMTW